jgi:Isocitrate/isopropylmalate dehydrogenase
MSAAGQNAGGPHRVTLIPGDGIGPEVTEATRRILAAAGARLVWEVRDVGLRAVERFGESLPDVWRGERSSERCERSSEGGGAAALDFGETTANLAGGGGL